MPKFLVDSSYCTRGGNVARWSTSVDAADVCAAVREAHRAIAVHHHGATKIDLRIILATPSPRSLPAAAGLAPHHSVQNHG